MVLQAAADGLPACHSLRQQRCCTAVPHDLDELLSSRPMSPTLACCRPQHAHDTGRRLPGCRVQDNGYLLHRS